MTAVDRQLKRRGLGQRLPDKDPAVQLALRALLRTPAPLRSPARAAPGHRPRQASRKPLHGVNGLAAPRTPDGYQKRRSESLMAPLGAWSSISPREVYRPR